MITEDKFNRKVALRQYRNEHNCKHCELYEKPRRCSGEFICLLEEQTKEALSERAKSFKKCQKDKIGNCQYCNESGTCFGFCLQKLLEEMHHKQREEQTHE